MMSCVGADDGVVKEMSLVVPKGTGDATPPMMGMDMLTQLQYVAKMGCQCEPEEAKVYIISLRDIANRLFQQEDYINGIEALFHGMRVIEYCLITMEVDDLYEQGSIVAYNQIFVERCEELIRKCNSSAALILQKQRNNASQALQLLLGAEHACSYQRLPKELRKALRSLVFGNLGCYYQNINNIPKALEYTTKSMKLMEELENKPSIVDQGRSYSNYSIVLSSSGKHKEALKQALKAYELLDQPSNFDCTASEEKDVLFNEALLVNRQSQLVVTMNMIANELIKLNNLKEAVLWHNKALAFAQVTLPNDHPIVDHLKKSCTETVRRNRREEIKANLTRLNQRTYDPIVMGPSEKKPLGWTPNRPSSSSSSSPPPPPRNSTLSPYFEPPTALKKRLPSPRRLRNLRPNDDPATITATTTTATAAVAGNVYPSTKSSIEMTSSSSSSSSRGTMQQLKQEKIEASVLLSRPSFFMDTKSKAKPSSFLTSPVFSPAMHQPSGTFFTTPIMFATLVASPFTNLSLAKKRSESYVEKTIQERSERLLQPSKAPAAAAAATDQHASKEDGVVQSATSLPSSASTGFKTSSLTSSSTFSSTSSQQSQQKASKAQTISNPSREGEGLSFRYQGNKVSQDKPRASRRRAPNIQAGRSIRSIPSKDSKDFQKIAVQEGNFESPKTPRRPLVQASERAADPKDLHRKPIAGEPNALKKKEEEAATKLQSWHRGKKARTVANEMKMQKQQQEAAIKLQSWHRGKKARTVASEMKMQKQQQEAAIKLQSWHRGKKARTVANEMKVQKQQQEAATKLQSWHRGKKARTVASKMKMQKEQQEAAIKLQSLHRGRKTRKTLAQRMEEEKGVKTLQIPPRGAKAEVETLGKAKKLTQNPDEAASKLQKFVRTKKNQKNKAAQVHEKKQKQKEAAIRLQSLERGRKARKHMQRQRMNPVALKASSSSSLSVNDGNVVKEEI